MNKNCIILILLFLMSIGNPIYGQFQNKRKSITNLKSSFYNSNVRNVAKPGFVDITRYLPKNHVVDGSVDYTKEIQKALNENKKIIMPNFPIMIKGVWVRSNSDIWFRSKSKLIMKPTADTHYMVLALIGVENVSIFNANIEGDYSKHLGKEGQWGYGIDIRGSRNIKISNCIISNCWGDGLVISSNPNKFTNNVKLFNTNNVTIERAVIDYNRRNGITIAGGENVIIRNSLISNTFGTQPKAGIDFEPDNSKPKMEGIYLENITFFNNASGINFYLNSYADKSVRKNIGIKLNNLVFEDQIMALVIYGFDQKIKKQALTGLVEVSGVKLKNVNKPIFRGADNHRIIPQFSIRNWNSAAKTMSKNELLKDVKNPIGLDIK